MDSRLSTSNVQDARGTREIAPGEVRTGEVNIDVERAGPVHETLVSDVA